MGLVYTEEDVQQRSGVLDTLTSLPVSDQYIDFSLKKQKIYALWTRNTIPWKLECDETPGRKQEVIDQISEELDIGDFDLYLTRQEARETMTVASCAIPLAFFTILAQVANIFCCKKINYTKDFKKDNQKAGICVFVSLLLLQFALSFGAIAIASTDLEQRNEIKETLAPIGQTINECSDDYTKIPDIFTDDNNTATDSL